MLLLNSHERTVRIYRPLATSKISEIFSFFSKQEIKYHDAKKVIAYGEGREVFNVNKILNQSLSYKVWEKVILKQQQEIEIKLFQVLFFLRFHIIFFLSSLIPSNYFTICCKNQF